MDKPRIVKDYEKLTEEVKEQLKLVYPRGFSQHLVSFVNKDGEKKLGLPFETDEVYFLVRMSVTKAEDIIEADDDFNDNGVLRVKAKEDYESKYDDIDYLGINANEDNDLTETYNEEI